ncbi:sensor histidine kinase [Methylocapsa palsarum]|uniref:histidine kinase n=1 Tax=Methylocapsa palsarum TaxID=1612308 RepID=A0A1I4AIK1_9HYPH|nr:ATP-binding protein [Methylocapsa palsarum]SFK56184.1 His Kinase A (phospho-acceptor) domain-containing protein [Methylocapsa palsarum]
MWGFVSALLSSDSLSPHGICLLWRPELIWTQVTADAVIGLAYYSIPFVLAYFAAKRPDFGFHRVIWCFVGFILACGTTHFMSIWTLWVPDYGLEALIKAITAVLSVATATLLWWLLPIALRMPSPEQLNEANAALALHVKERDDALLALRKESEDLHLAQDMLRQAQKMEAVGQLTGGVAHDFNNLLTAILMSLDRAAKQGGSDPKLEKSLKIATAAAERAAALTNQMLAFARKQPLRPMSVEVNELIENLAPLVKNILGERGVLRLELDPEVGNVWIDRNQLEQALLNLTVNARDAFEARGVMTVTTHPVNFRRDGETVTGTQIVVADSGSGMSEEVKARAFDPFFTTKEVGKGSGLGLSQVYGFVQQSGGTIELQSQPGRGTRISIQLPVTAKA